MNYIWYGKDKFDKSLFEKLLCNRGEPFTDKDSAWKQFSIYNKGWLKPRCIPMIWGSPTDIHEKDFYTWKDFCEENNFHVGKFKDYGSNEEPINGFQYYQKFKLTNDAKILKINSWESIIEFFEKYTKIQKEHLKILTDEYDHYKAHGTYRINRLMYDFIFSDIYTYDEIEINYEKIYEEFDGMEVYHFDFNLVHAIFNLCDCDSICVWHKNKIEFLDGGKCNGAN